MQVERFSGSELFDVRVAGAIPGNPGFLDLAFPERAAMRNQPHRLVGPGVYAIFLDDRLCYIGRFFGTKASVFGGRITTTRWDKHIGTLTGRGHRVSLSAKALAAVRQGIEGPVGDAFRMAEAKDVCVPNGMVASANSIRFAAHHWADFSRLDAATLGRFTFVYVRLEAADLPDPDRQQAVRTAVDTAETDLVRRFQPYKNAYVRDGSLTSEHHPDAVASAIKEVLGGAIRDAYAEAAEDADALIDDPDRDESGPADDMAETATEAAADAAIDPETCRAIMTITDPTANRFVTMLRAQMDVIRSTTARYEVHCTGTNGGDLRLREYPPTGPARNVLTIYWQRQAARFKCRARHRPGTAPGVIVNANPGKDPLAEEFTVAPDAANFEAQIAALLQAATGSP